MTEEMEVGDIRVFTKSGNLVKLVEPDGDGWTVERVDGTSAGKQMWCPTHALADKQTFFSE